MQLLVRFLKTSPSAPYVFFFGAVFHTINQELQGIIDEKTALTRTVADFKRLGVQPQEVVGDGEKAILYRLETSPGVYEYYLGLTNFYAVWQYNHSRMYVTAVRDIANGVSGDYRL